MTVLNDDILCYTVYESSKAIIGNMTRAISCGNALADDLISNIDLLIPQSIKSGNNDYESYRILSNAFCHVQKITSVFIPKTIKQIDQNAFYDCKNLKTVTFEEGSKLQIIMSRAFNQCHSLESLYLPPSLKTLEDSAIGNYRALKKIIYCGRSDFSKINSTFPDFGYENTKIYAVMGLYKFEKFGIVEDVILTNKCIYNPSIKGHFYTCKQSNILQLIQFSIFLMNK